jgi:hypothetical protein
MLTMRKISVTDFFNSTGTRRKYAEFLQTPDERTFTGSCFKAVFDPELTLAGLIKGIL